MRRKQHQQLQPQLRWGPERGSNLAAAPALIDTLLSVGREARMSCISQHMWPVNQGVSSSLRLHFLHRPNQLWKNRQRLPLERAPPPPLHLPWLPLCK